MQVVENHLPDGYNSSMLPRHITPHILAALADTPVVFLAGPRQAGKSTLTQWLAAGPHPARYLTLDDATVLSAATRDPNGFLAGLDGPVVLDEVQRAPGLYLALKAAVDRDRAPGRFLLTGSAKALMLPQLTEALVGRMEVLTLWPFAQCELPATGGPQPGFVDALLGDEWPPVGEGVERGEVLRRALVGGYPEVMARQTSDRRRAWFGSYVTTILQRDVRDLARIEGLADLSRLLALMAARATGLLNYAELSRSSALPQTTLKRYLALLEATYLVQMLPAWSGNLGRRLVKSPKLLFVDTGLMSYLLGLNNEADLRLDSPAVGSLVESFVAVELLKQLDWSQAQPRMYHFRSHVGQEVDLLLEDARGRLVGIEVKASSEVSPDDFRGLRALAEQIGPQFHRGVVLYAGRKAVPFGDRMRALPISSLWTGG